MADLTLDKNAYYEQKHLKEQDTVIEAIRRHYNEVIAQISPLIASGANRIAINRKLDKMLEEMVRKSVASVETGMQKSWDLALDRTKAVVESKYKGIVLPPQIQEAIDDRRQEAFNRFARRREGGLNLSDRIWKPADQFKELVNTKLDEGISEGRSAAKVARELREALQNPEKTQKPGQGVYKSPVRNTERVARTEINMTYRMADQDAWANNPLILGYTINLSATGKPKARCELCRLLAGDYPVTFVWKGWHPHCLCFKTPILMSREMLDAYNKLVARGEDTPSNIEKLQRKVRVMEPPGALKTWVTSNAERVGKWKNNPYWWDDNSEMIEGWIRMAG